MRRRDFIGALLLTPLAGSAAAQTPNGLKRLALADPVISVANMRIGGDSGYAFFLEELQQQGYVEGRNLVIERYSAEGNTERYADFAHQIVSTQPDIIVAAGSRLAREFKAATDTIPIVAMTGDPISLGLVSSLAHPGGNLTGVTVDAGGLDLWGKRLELLTEAVPKARTAHSQRHL